MNGPPDYHIERSVTPRGYILHIRPPHKSCYSPYKLSGKPVVYQSHVAALQGAVQAVIDMGWGNVRGTANGKAKQRLIDDVFGARPNANR